MYPTKYGSVISCFCGYIRYSTQMPVCNLLFLYLLSQECYSDVCAGTCLPEQCESNSEASRNSLRQLPGNVTSCPWSGALGGLCLSPQRYSYCTTIGGSVVEWLGRRTHDLRSRVHLPVTTLPGYYRASICEAGLGSRNSVCPSVRPSVTRVDCDKTK